MFRPVSHSVKAFTIVEVLVVITVVTLLLSFLLPSLQTARERARGLMCTANERQQLIALNCYLSDNNQFVPPLYIQAAAFPSVGGYPNWPLVTFEDRKILGQYTGNDYQKDGVTDTYNQYLASTKSLWFCPSYSGANTGTNGTTLYGTYGPTANFCPIMTAPADYANLFKSSAIRKPSVMIYQGDSGGRQWDPSGWWPNYTFYGTTDTVAEAAVNWSWGPTYILNYRIRHNGNTSANFGFFDGHAQSLTNLKDAYVAKTINISMND